MVKDVFKVHWYWKRYNSPDDSETARVQRELKAILDRRKAEAKAAPKFGLDLGKGKLLGSPKGSGEVRFCQDLVFDAWQGGGTREAEGEQRSLQGSFFGCRGPRGGGGGGGIPTVGDITTLSMVGTVSPPLWECLSAEFAEVRPSECPSCIPH